MVPMVGTAITASSRAGTIVQPISSRVLPWTCFGFSFLPSRYRNFTATKIVAAMMKMPTRMAMIATGVKRLSIFSASAPFGFNTF